MAQPMPTLDEALTRLRARTPEMHANTRRWVEVNSYTANIEGVNQVGGLLRDERPVLSQQQYGQREPEPDEQQVGAGEAREGMRAFAEKRAPAWVPRALDRGQRL